MVIDVRLKAYPTLANKYRWWSIKVTPIRTDTIIYYVTNSDVYTAPIIGGHMALFASEMDTDSWELFDHYQRYADDHSFWNDAPLNQPVYICQWPGYPFSRVERLMGEWKSSTFTSSPPSATDYIIANATPRLAVTGRTAPALPFYAFRLTNPASINDKNIAIFTTSNHCNETPGNFAFEGAIEFLLGNDAEAIVLRDWFDIYCYPCLDPQGKWAGYYRSTVEETNRDHNFSWHLAPPVLETHSIMKAAMHIDCPGGIALGLDFHASMGVREFFTLVWNVGDRENIAFRDALQVYIPGFDYMERAINEGTLQYRWEDEFDTGNLKLSLELEASNLITYSVQDYKDFGKYIMLAIYDMLIAGKFQFSPP